MSKENKTLIDLETKFWQAMVDEDNDTATSLLAEPAVMVSTRGAFQFDHGTYCRMAEMGPRVLTSFKLRKVQVLFPNEDTAVLTYNVQQGVAPREDRSSTEFEDTYDTSTWVRVGNSWKCVMHTETPTATEAAL